MAVWRGTLSGSPSLNGRRGKTDDDRLSDVSTKRHRNCGMPAFNSLFGELSWLLSPEKRFLCSKRTERFWEGARSHHRGSFVALRYFCTLPHGHLGPDGADDGRFGFGSKTFSKVHIKTKHFPEFQKYSFNGSRLSTSSKLVLLFPEHKNDKIFTFRTPWP